MSTRPNILVILCDQMRRGAMSCTGDSNVRTPHIDQLATEGVRFANACTTYPVCVPTRFSLMTGQYAHTRHVPAIGWRMSPGERTIAHAMNEAGYETVYIGKWHLYGGHPNTGFYYTKAGYTHIPKAHRGGFAKWRAFEFRNSMMETVYFHDDDPEPRRVQTYQTDGLFDLAIDYIKNERSRDRPFFQILSVEPPHPPYEAPDEYRIRMEEREIRLAPNVSGIEEYKVKGPGNRDFWDDIRTYYAMIENLDDNVGRMMKTLEEEGLRDQTAVVFISDHGELMGSHGLSDKQYPYEESVGVPFIVSNPAGDIPSGKIIAEPTSTEDWFPTLCGLAGIDAGPHYPGADLTKLMKGQHKLEREGVMLEFVAEHRHDHVFFDETWRAFRTARYKYVLKGDYLGAEPWMLFDLEEDPCEMNNLIQDSDYASIAGELHRLLLERLAETDDDYEVKPAFGCPGYRMWAHRLPVGHQEGRRRHL